MAHGRYALDIANRLSKVAKIVMAVSGTAMNTEMPNIDSLIGAFYEATFDPSQWVTALDGFAQLTGSTGACLVLGDSSLPRANIVHWFGHAPEAIQAYNDYYFAMDPLVRIAAYAPPGVWLNDWRDAGPDKLLGSEFYNDFMVRYDTHAAMACLLIRMDTVVSSLSAQRALGMEPFTSQDQSRAQLVLPHIQRAVRLHHRISSLGIQAAMGAAALDHVSAPIFVTDVDGRVLIANRSAEDLCALSHAITIQAGKLNAFDHTRELHHAIANAARQSGTRATTLRLRGPNDADQLQVLCAPLSAKADVASFWQRPLAFVVVHRQGALPPTVDEILHGLFGLSNAEARVARLLVNGHAPSEVSELLNVTLFTVRSQMKAIFSKTGARRQAELSRLVTALGLIGSPM